LEHYSICEKCIHSYDVTIANGSKKYICLRYFDEEIACPHILKVLDHAKQVLLLNGIIGQVYNRERMLSAFPGKNIFVPNDYYSFQSNLLVVSRNSEQNIGRLRIRRYACPANYSKGGTLPNSVSRPPPGIWILLESEDDDGVTNDIVLASTTTEDTERRDIGGEQFIQQTLISEGSEMLEWDDNNETSHHIEQSEGLRSNDNIVDDEHRRDPTGNNIIVEINLSSSEEEASTESAVDGRTNETEAQQHSFTVDINGIQHITPSRFCLRVVESLYQKKWGFYK